MTQDIGTAIKRFEDYPKSEKQIYTVGNEQDYHFKVLFKILDKLGYSWAKECYHLSYGMIDLPDGKMKSREGTVVDADELITLMKETAKNRTVELGKIDDFDSKDLERLYNIIALSALKYHLLKVDGAMIGRAIYHSPYFLADIERDIFNNENVPTRSDVMEKLIPYIQEETSKGVQLNHIMRHTVGLFHGQNGSRTWKQYLSKNMCIRDADLQKVNHIMDQVRKTNPVSLER